MPNAFMRSATSAPMRPRPITPSRLPYSSTPVYFERFHSPAFSEPWAAAMLRAAARMWPQVSSAAEMMFDVGALTTMTPASVAAGTSTLSSPTPARAMTFSCGAAAIASASIWVAERISTASTSRRSSRRRARSAPSVRRISKSGPRASTVAGESSSAIRTTGWAALTGAPGGVVRWDGRRAGPRSGPSLDA